MRRFSAFTLIEIIIAIAVMVFAILGILNVTTFYGVQAKSLMELADCQAQLNFAAADIKLHLMSAQEVKTFFQFASSADSTATLTSFKVDGERDVYTITPQDRTNFAEYEYLIDNNRLIRKTIDASVTSTDVLVDARYQPGIVFRYERGDPPNFMTVHITGHTRTQPLGKDSTDVTRSVGVRFWFVDIFK